MALLYLTCVAERTNSTNAEQLIPSQRLRDAARADRRAVHRLTDSPEDADVIVFAESHYDGAACGLWLEGVRRDPLFRKFRAKSFVISGMDQLVPLVPGLYASLEERWRWATLAASSPYLVAPNPCLRSQPLDQTPSGGKWLASFVGASERKPVRQKLMLLSDPDIFLRDNSEPFIAAIRSGNQERLMALKRDYIETSVDSKFILCPRGTGASSIRLFEAMEIGRAPVIISDQWVAPNGPDWNKFAIRVLERDLSRLPAILREHEPAATVMGAAARNAWEQHFSPDSLFHWVAEECLRMSEKGPLARNIAGSLAWLHVLRPFHLRMLLQGYKRKLRKKV